MSDPELRSDETILLRTPGVFVKSIAFEGYLTNKRIILIDRIKNLLPQKEIPLVTIKDIEAGENAIRDQIITLSILAKNGETRQMILTFSRQTGGNRIRERNDWVRLLKENTSSSIEQVIRKVIPASEPVIRKVIPASGPVLKKPETKVPPRVEVTGTAVSQNVPAAVKIPLKKEVEPLQPVKKIIESRPEPARPSASKEDPLVSVPSFGTYCSRCGNRVPEGSGFCNRCGSQIVIPGSITAATPPSVPVPQPVDSRTKADGITSIDTEIQATPRSEYPTVTVPQSLPREVPGEPVEETGMPTGQETAVQLRETAWPVSDVTIPDADEKPGPASIISPLTHYSDSVSPAGEPPAPEKPFGGFTYKLSKKAVISIVIAIILVVVAGAFFLYPMISGNGGATSGNDSVLAPVMAIFKNTTTTIMPANAPPPGNSGSRVGL